MATGDAWNIQPEGEAPKDGWPWALWDPNDITDVPFDVTEEMAKAGSAYASHEMLSSPELTVSAGSYSAPFIKPRVQASGSPALVAGEKYSFTYRITFADGQRRDVTLFFKVREN